MNDGLPLVSIMMPVYNIRKYVGEAIESMIAQTYQKWELLVCDDGSNDDTPAIVEKFMSQDSRIKMERTKHLGCPYARNTCLEMSVGEIIGRLDGDDRQTPDRIEKQVNWLLEHESDSLVTTRMIHFWDNKKEFAGGKAPMVPNKYFNGSGGTPVNASIVAWVQVYDKVGGFNKKYLQASDGEWNFRCLLEGFKWGYIHEPMYYYRVRDTSISRSAGRKQMSLHHKARHEFKKQWIKQGSGGLKTVKNARKK